MRIDRLLYVLPKVSTLPSSLRSASSGVTCKESYKTVTKEETRLSKTFDRTFMQLAGLDASNASHAVLSAPPRFAFCSVPHIFLSGLPLLHKRRPEQSLEVSTFSGQGDTVVLRFLAADAHVAIASANSVTEMLARSARNTLNTKKVDRGCFGTGHVTVVHSDSDRVQTKVNSSAAAFTEPYSRPSFEKKESELCSAPAHVPCPESL